MAALDSSAGLLFKIRADTSDSVAKLAAMKVAIKELATHTNTQATSLQKDFKAVASELSSLVGIFTGNRLSGATSQITSFSTAVGALPGAAGAAAGAIGGLAVAAVGAAAALFELAKASSESVKTIGIFSDLTGQSVERVSALRYALNFMHKDLSDIQPSMIFFAKQLDAAASGSDKAAAALKRVGVTQFDDLNAAFTVAAKHINDTGNDVERLGESMAVFGRRGGATMIKTIQVMDGDVDEFTTKAKKLGVTLSDDDVRAAEQFSHTYEKVMFQAKIAAEKFALAYSGEISSAMDIVSKKLTENQDAWHKWGTGVGSVIKSLLTDMESAVSYLSDRPNLLKFIVFSNPASAVGFMAAQELLNAGAGGSFARTPPTNRPDVANDPRNPFYKPPLNEGGASGGATDRSTADEQLESEKKAADERAKAREAARQEELKNQKEHIKQLLDAEHDYFEKDNQFFEEQFQKKAITEDEWRETSEKNYEIYTAKIKKLLIDQFKLDEQGETPSGIRNLRFAKGEANAAVDDEVTRMRADREKAITGELKDIDDKQKKQNEADHDRLQGIYDAENAEYEDHLQWQKDWAARIKAQRQGDHDRLQSIHDQQEAEHEEHEQWEKDWAARIKAQKDAAVQAQFNKLGGGVVGGLFQGLGISVKDMLEPVDKLNQLGKILAGTFQQVAQGVGDAVKSFVLFGTAGGSFKKFAAEVIASIAQMSVVQAIFELAQGIAMSALFWFTGNPKYAKSATEHSVAAAVFGAIGGVAAVAGRAVAGNSFQQQTAGGGASGGNTQSQGSGSAGTQYSPNPDQSLDIGRNGLGGFVIRDKSGMFDQMFTIAWERNGRMRRTLTTELGR